MDIPIFSVGKKTEFLNDHLIFFTILEAFTPPNLLKFHSQKFFKTFGQFFLTTSRLKY